MFGDLSTTSRASYIPLHIFRNLRAADTLLSTLSFLVPLVTRLTVFLSSIYLYPPLYILLPPDIDYYDTSHHLSPGVTA